MHVLILNFSFFTFNFADFYHNITEPGHPGEGAEIFRIKELINVRRVITGGI
jgi:hypothetical protein